LQFNAEIGQKSLFLRHQDCLDAGGAKIYADVQPALPCVPATLAALLCNDRNQAPVKNPPKTVNKSPVHRTNQTHQPS